MTFNDFSVLLKGCIQTSQKFYLICEEENDTIPNKYGVEFANGERYIFYSFNGGDFKAEFFLNGIFVDSTSITREFYLDFYNSILTAKNSQN